MTRKLLQTKHDYVDYIAMYMYNNHISYKTLEETRQSWRQERAYDIDIESELITKSLLFMSLLDGDLDLVFRKKIANYIAGYLAVYTSKSQKYANCKNQQEKEATARLVLNGVFTKWIDGVEATKKNRKAAKKKAKRKRIVTPKPMDTTRTICEVQSDGSVVQKIGVGSRAHKITYQNITEYKQKRDADYARVMKEYHM